MGAGLQRNVFWVFVTLPSKQKEKHGFVQGCVCQWQLRRESWQIKYIYVYLSISGSRLSHLITLAIIHFNSVTFHFSTQTTFKYICLLNPDPTKPCCCLLY